MNLKKSPFTIQDKNTRDLDIPNNYPTIADLMKEQKSPRKIQHGTSPKRFRFSWLNYYDLIVMNFAINDINL